MEDFIFDEEPYDNALSILDRAMNKYMKNENDESIRKGFCSLIGNTAILFASTDYEINGKRFGRVEKFANWLKKFSDAHLKQLEEKNGTTPS